MRDVRLLYEREMISPWFDVANQFFSPSSPQVPLTPQRGRRELLVVLSPPRSGSYHFCRLLWELGYGMPTEYFNPILFQSLRRFSSPTDSIGCLLRQPGLWLRRHYPGRPDGRSICLAPSLPDRKWLQNLIQERSASSKLTGRRFFSVKLQAHQLGRVSTALRRVFAPMQAQGLWQPFSLHPPKILLLFRHNLARSVASFHFSLCSGSFDQGRIFSYQHRPLQMLGDQRALLTDLAAYRVHLEWLVDALTHCPFPIHGLAFEDLISHQDEQLDALLRVIDPVEECPERTNRAEILNFRIAREESQEAMGWNQERQQWLAHLEDRIDQLHLLQSREGLRAQELIQILKTGCHPLPLRIGSESAASATASTSNPSSASGYR